MSSNIVNFPYFPIPPPPAHVVPPQSPPLRPVTPPPPPPHHPISPPSPPPPPSPDHGPTIIIIVFVSLGCIFFLALFLLALWCLANKRKTRATEETDIIRTDEHLEIKGAIVEGPHGPQAIVLSIDDDKHVEEEIIKTEKSRELANDIGGGESSPSASVIHNHLSLGQRH